MSIPTDDELYKLADDIQTEAALAMATDPMSQEAGPPAQWSPSGTDNSGDPVLDHFKGRFAHVTGVFERFMTPDCTQYESVEHEMVDQDSGLFHLFNVPDTGKANKTPLMAPRADIDRLETAINNSVGDTFQAFANQYLDNFDAIWFNHASITKALGLAAKATKQSRSQARVDLHAIGEATRGALKDLGGGASLSDSLAVVSMVAGTLALVPPLSAAAGGVSLVTSVGSYVAPDGEPSEGDAEDSKYTISGSEPISIVASMCDAINTLEEDVRKAENHIATQLSRFNRAIEAPQYSKYVLVKDINFPTTADV